MTDAQNHRSASARFSEEQAHTLDALTTAMAYRVVLSFVQYAQADSKKVEQGLALLWATHDATIDESQMKRGDAVMVLVLREYFSHRGDWEAMRACMRGRLKRLAPGAAEVEPSPGGIFWHAAAQLPFTLCDAMNEFAEKVHAS